MGMEPKPEEILILPASYSMDLAYIPLPTTCYLLPYSLLSAVHSLLPTPCSLLPAPYSLLPTPCSLLPARYCLLSIPCSLLPTAYDLHSRTAWSTHAKHCRYM